MSRGILAVPLLAAALAPSAGAQALCTKPVYDAPLSPQRIASGATKLYVAGLAPGSGSFHRVAEHDGSSWSLLPGEFDGPVLALAETSAGLVAGGGFTSVGGVPAAGVARFEAGSWAPLGSGLAAPGVVAAVVEHAGELHVAGDFALAGGAPAANVVRWDGAAWQPLGGGLDAPGATLASHQGLLYVGGAFATAGGQPLANVAAWDGAQFLPAAANGLTEVYELDTGNGRLYAAADGVYRLGGGLWNELGDLPLETSVFARELAIVDGVPFAAGPWLTFCLDLGGGPCLAGARFLDGAWSLFMTEDQVPAFGALALEDRGDDLFMSGALYFLVGTGLVEYADEADLNSVQPKFGAWYQPNALTLTGGCLAPGTPATLRLGSAPPLPVTVTSETQATVTVPAGHVSEAGLVDAVLQQEGDASLLPNAFEVRPSLSALLYVLFVYRIDLTVASTSGSGTAWFLWSAGLLPGAVPVPGIHGAFLLSPATFFVFGTGSLADSPTLSVPYSPALVPGGATLHVQALVAELDGGTFHWSFTDADSVTFPFFP